MANQVLAQEQPAAEPMLGPTSVNAGGQDFVDAKGRRWIATGKVQFRKINVADLDIRRTLTYERKAAPEKLTPDQLAEALRPRRLVGDVEYRLEKPDYELAAKIMKGGKAPTTKGNKPPEVSGPPFIIGSDDRTRIAAPRFWPGSPFGYLGQTCTLTMIGPSTALSAAHCFYNSSLGGWIATPSLTLAADTNAPTAPFGSFMADSLTLPGQWNSNEWDWDFAVLEFSPTRRPGDQTGYYGTEESSSGGQTMIGYPSDKPIPSQWIKRGTYTASPGSRYEHNLDVIPGDSGACTYNANDRCTGIQSTQWRDSKRIWNEVRRWDRTTYDFFDTYGNWPP
ncbi:MAG: trypsin-like serine protease [Verrucomicrobia subdivision 3 bacterium]|nr:trypsin-like serine protease [Limisphaerales bacterium]